MLERTKLQAVRTAADESTEPTFVLPTEDARILFRQHTYLLGFYEGVQAAALSGARTLDLMVVGEPEEYQRAGVALTYLRALPATIRYGVITAALSAEETRELIRKWSDGDA